MRNNLIGFSVFFIATQKLGWVFALSYLFGYRYVVQKRQFKSVNVFLIGWIFNILFRIQSVLVFQLIFVDIV